jgi:RNA-binding protein 39
VGSSLTRESGNWVPELEEEVKEECEGSYGPVIHLAAEKNSPGEIYVKFTRVQDAEKAATELQKRFFGGKHISVEYVAEALYNARFPMAP